jgi:hypothetical protein
MFQKADTSYLYFMSFQPKLNGLVLFSPNNRPDIRLTDADNSFFYFNFWVTKMMILLLINHFNGLESDSILVVQASCLHLIKQLLICVNTFQQ